MSNLEQFEVFAAPDMIPVGAVCKRSTLISIATSIASVVKSIFDTGSSY
jgi:hypothetical protein